MWGRQQCQEGRLEGRKVWLSPLYSLCPIRICLLWSIIVSLLSSIILDPSVPLSSLHSFCFSLSALLTASPSFLSDTKEMGSNFPLAYVKCLCTKQYKQQTQSITFHIPSSWFPTATVPGLVLAKTRRDKTEIGKTEKRCTHKYQLAVLSCNKKAK